MYIPVSRDYGTNIFNTRVIQKTHRQGTDLPKQAQRQHQHFELRHKMNMPFTQQRENELRNRFFLDDKNKTGSEPTLRKTPGPKPIERYRPIKHYLETKQKNTALPDKKVSDLSANELSNSNECKDLQVFLKNDQSTSELASEIQNEKFQIFDFTFVKKDKQNNKAVTFNLPEFTLPQKTAYFFSNSAHSQNKTKLNPNFKNCVLNKNNILKKQEIRKSVSKLTVGIGCGNESQITLQLAELKSKFKEAFYNYIPFFRKNS